MRVGLKASKYTVVIFFNKKTKGNVFFSYFHQLWKSKIEMYKYILPSIDGSLGDCTASLSIPNMAFH